MSGAPRESALRVLAVDAGNSSTKAARWDGAWSDVLRLPADAPPDAVTDALHALGPVDVAGLAAVVPAAALRRAIGDATGHAPHVVSARSSLPFRLDYATPDTLGADRIAAAVAAHALVPHRPVVALDAGTALTLDAVDVAAGGAVYRGGIIAPGADLLRRALARDTSALPDVPLSETAPALGDSTAACIAAGVAGMWLGGVRHLLAEVSATLSASPAVVLTGGGAPWLARHGVAGRVEPRLVLDGVRRLVSR